MHLKLTLVSITFHNRLFSVFVMAPMINGKAVVDGKTVDNLLAAAGCTARGLTYSIG